MAKTSRKTIIDKLFDIGILIKAFFGIIEFLGGILLVISGRKVVDNLITIVTKAEIEENPRNFLANYLINVGDKFTLSTQIFAIIYLTLHGVINISLAIALAKGKTSIYPLCMLGFGAFVFYQFYKFLFSHSVMLLLLTLFDILFILIIWLEYKRKKRKK